MLGKVGEISWDISVDRISFGDFLVSSHTRTAHHRDISLACSGPGVAKIATCTRHGSNQDGFRL